MRNKLLSRLRRHSNVNGPLASYMPLIEPHVLNPQSEDCWGATSCAASVETERKVSFAISKWSLERMVSDRRINSSILSPITVQSHSRTKENSQALSGERASLEKLVQCFAVGTPASSVAETCPVTVVLKPAWVLLGIPGHPCHSLTYTCTNPHMCTLQKCTCIYTYMQVHSYP